MVPQWPEPYVAERQHALLAEVEHDRLVRAVYAHAAHAGNVRVHGCAVPLCCCERVSPGSARVVPQPCY